MSAVLSPCRRYRYRLERLIASTGLIYAFVGVNPSTADHFVDDHTVRKLRGFVTAWGGSRFIVGNVFAYRATDVRDLACAGDPVGPDNEGYLRAIAQEADVIVPCWGNSKKIPRSLRPALDETLGLLEEYNKPIMSFGLSKNGDPLHPLTLPYSTKLVSYGRAA